jgi:molybdopterin molybdotransferase
MVKYPEALRRIREVASGQRLSIERVSLLESVGRICAEDLLSSEMVPPFANSSMDGFAVRSSMTGNAGPTHPLRIKVLGSIAAGDTPPLHPAQDGAWEIMTGAPFPEGFDASVKIEETLVIKDASGKISEIEINSAVSPRQNWRGAGEDFKPGATVVKKGRMLTSEHVLALSSLGLTEIPVFRRVKVGLISTGRELVPMDQIPAAGRIRNSTAPYLIATLRTLGAEVTHLGTILDDPEEFQKLMKRVLKENFDLILTTGAVSMGKFDFVTEGIDRLGADVYFHKVAIRPGKPLLFAQIKNGPVIFGLPGNPVSGVVALRFFIDPYLRELNRMKPERPMRARLAAKSTKPEGLRCFFKSRLTFTDAEPTVEVLPGQMSFLVSPLLQSTAWAILPEETADLEAGAWVDVYPMHFSDYDWRGGHVESLHRSSHRNHKEGCC